MANGLYRCFSGLGLGSCFSCFNVFRRSNQDTTNPASASLVFVSPIDSKNVNLNDDGSVDISSDANGNDGDVQNLGSSQSITFTTQVPRLNSDAGLDLLSPPTIQPEKGLLPQQNDQNQAGGLILPFNDKLVLPVELEPVEIAPSTPRSNAINQSSKSLNDLHSSIGSQDQRTPTQSQTPKVLKTRIVKDSFESLNSNMEQTIKKTAEIVTVPREMPEGLGTEPNNSLQGLSNPKLSSSDPSRFSSIEELERQLELAESKFPPQWQMSSLESEAPRNPSPIPLQPIINFASKPQNNPNLVSQEGQFSTTRDGVFLLNNQQAREFENQQKAEALQIFAIPSANSIRPILARKTDNSVYVKCLWV
jgi:hypothetical protein